MGSWDYVNLVRTEFSSKLPQELRQIVRYRPQTEPQTFGKIAFQHFRQKLNFYRGFKGNRLGQNVRNDRGIISGFHKNNDFDMQFAGQSPCFPENHDFHFLCLKNIFLFQGQICEEYNHFPFSEHIYLWIFIDFL